MWQERTDLRVLLWPLHAPTAHKHKITTSQNTLKMKLARLEVGQLSASDCLLCPKTEVWLQVLQKPKQNHKWAVEIQKRYGFLQLQCYFLPKQPFQSGIRASEQMTEDILTVLETQLTRHSSEVLGLWILSCVYTERRESLEGRNASSHVSWSSWWHSIGGEKRSSWRNTRNKSISLLD